MISIYGCFFPNIVSKMNSVLSLSSSVVRMQYPRMVPVQVVAFELMRAIFVSEVFVTFKCAIKSIGLLR